MFIYKHPLCGWVDLQICLVIVTHFSQENTHIVKYSKQLEIRHNIFELTLRNI